jgi:hypothetical protein
LLEKIYQKDLNKGQTLVDDREKNGAGEFEGELILFGSVRFGGWKTVRDYLLNSICPIGCNGK